MQSFYIKEKKLDQIYKLEKKLLSMPHAKCSHVLTGTSAAYVGMKKLWFPWWSWNWDQGSPGRNKFVAVQRQSPELNYAL